MKRFTQEDITILEANLIKMKEGNAEVELSQLTQDNLDEFVVLFNMLVTEYATAINKETKVLGNLKLSELSEITFKSLSNIMIEASEGLVEIAKGRLV